MNVHLHVELTLAEAKAYFLLTAQLVNMPDKAPKQRVKAVSTVFVWVI